MLENINYTDAVRTFAYYFVNKYGKDLSQVNTRSFGNGFFRDNNNKRMFEFLGERIGLKSI